ncbi:bifunctional preprotein translocase subunit SecD/SecF [Candidatus Omnitrophus magneticus]|uniref:Multifunctional fusion protein n=1 Tax=Candidatus Omnitrophus magneticus TaxID=1609969 RepID=A0A0F0CMJ9_9BACT|nr:bifunctional preprotein translocase subunit SecD/SecF [Candidatus Omnitrophus magneticus]
MWTKLKWKSVLVVVLAGLAVWFSYPPFNIIDKNGKLVKSGKMNLGLDLQGGMHLLLQVDTTNISEEEAKDAPLRAIEIIRNRIDQFGVMEPVVQLQGGNRILVQLPGVTDRDRAKEIVGRTAHLEFKIVSDDPELLKKALAGEKVDGYEVKKMKTRDKKTEDVLVGSKALLTGNMLLDTRMDYSSEGFGQPYVALEMNDEGAKIFASVTGSNIGKRLAVLLDGVVYTAPFIREAIPSGRAQITGNFSVEEAKDLSIVLRAGSLPAPVNIIEERSVGPELGKDSIDKGLSATLIAGIAVIIFMGVYYLIAGVIANIALVLNLLLIIGAMACFKATLTLPGIAGLVLTIGMAVDANVLIFERIREELKLGKNLRAAISAGFDKAFLTIFDSNLTTLITAIILFQFGTGPVRGFATTLSIGIVTSMFTALTVTRLMLDLITLGGPKLEKIKMFQFFNQPSIPFLKYRKPAYLVSIIIIFIGMTVFILKGEKNYGVDFTGGMLQQFKFNQPVSENDIRGVLVQAGVADAKIQRVVGGKEFIIRSQNVNSDNVVSGLKEKFGDKAFEVMRVETVGPAVGADLRKTAIKALFFAMIGICIYVAFRFEFRFAVTAIIALVHDVLVGLGMVAITGREISLPVVAALLTIVGYSINDTIVIFDRIREDKKFKRKASEEDVINMSLNETLSRTILTSLTVLIVVIVLFLFGGEVINDFAFVMMVGVISGSYSTVFIASPLLIDWPSKKVKVKR